MFENIDKIKINYKNIKKIISVHTIKDGWIEIDDNKMTYEKHFNDFWLPILQKQFFKYKLTNDKQAIESLESNVMKNWNLKKEDKIKILKKIRGRA